jgi:hypothetical protein
MDEIPATLKKDFPSKHETPYYRHFRLHWFRRMIEQAPDFGLVRIAGDLLDMFKFETRLERAREIRSLIRLLAAREINLPRSRSTIRNQTGMPWTVRSSAAEVEQRVTSATRPRLVVSGASHQTFRLACCK